MSFQKIFFHISANCKKTQDRIVVGGVLTEHIKIKRMFPDVEYQKEAIIPNFNWSAINQEMTREFIISDVKNIQYDRLCSVIKIPLSFYKLFDELLKSSDSELLESGIKEYSQYLEKKYSSRGNPIFNGIAFYPHSKPTVSFISDSKTHVGLHIDNWDQMPLNKTNLASNRICLNLGKSPRYFLIVPYTFISIIKKVRNEFAGQNATDYGRYFLRTMPFMPIFKVKILPSEAYIAPTENCIHDGSTLGMIEDDLSITFRGFFSNNN